MINSYFSNGKQYSFSRRSASATGNGNIFTIIVGKNGTGKSRLLRGLVFDLLRDEINLRDFSDLPSGIKEHSIGEIEGEKPLKVVCVSTSPFDRFPLPRRDQNLRYYSYLGLRGLATANLGLAYLGRVIHALMAAASRDRTHASSIATVLDYLGYEPAIKASFRFSSPTLAQRMLGGDDPREAIGNYVNGSITRLDHTFALKKLLDVDDKTMRNVLSALTRLSERSSKQAIEVWLSRDGVSVYRSGNVTSEEITLLSEYGVLQLRDVELRKATSDSVFKINEMSSGEQSVIMSLLGIGSQIQDNALICIDEPEVCLHPEWQERYIQLLSSIFSHHTGCHFIIATHSPQIVSQLPRKSCYIMEMETGAAQRSAEFYRKSIDFQLATLFNAPGFRNEYISRISINLFLKAGKAKYFDAEDKSQVRFLKKVVGKIPEGDPLLEVIDSIDQMYKKYG